MSNFDENWYIYQLYAVTEKSSVLTTGSHRHDISCQSCEIGRFQYFILRYWSCNHAEYGLWIFRCL